MTGELRIGVLGTGVMGRELATRVARLPRMTLVGVFDPVAAAAEAVAGQLGARVAGSAEELIAAGDVDAVVVATPMTTHEGLVLQACSAGKHVYCEKPFAPTVAICDRLLGAAGGAGVRLMVGQVLRLWPRFRLAQQVVESGEIGRLRSVLVRRSGDARHFADSWRGRRDDSGGLLFEMNSHELDYLRCLAGEPKWVSAHGSTGLPGVDYDDVMTVVLELGDGVIGELHTSIASTLPLWDAVLHGSEGTLMFAAEEGDVRWRRFDGELQARTAPDFADADPYKLELSSFADWVLDGTPPLLTGWDGRQAVAMAEAAYLSAGSGSRVQVAPRT
jgi:predicted dehydrogenase